MIQFIKLERLVLIIITISAFTACASHEPKVSEADFESNLPEVKEITFQGNKTFSASTLIEQMATQPRPFLQFWKRGGDYNPSTLDADLLRLRRYYFNSGFLSTGARIIKVQKNAEANAVRIKIEIEEGPATIVKAIHIGGEVPPELPSEKTLLKDLPLRPKKRINREKFDDSRSELLHRMQNEGYARAEIIPNTEVNTETNEAVVTFSLQPGKRTSFGRISVEGLERLPEYVITRHLDIAEGDTYSAKALDDNKTRLFDLGMFRSVTPRALNLAETDAPVDIEFDVRERKPRTFKLGIGASTIESMRYQVKWIDRNLFKEAESLTLSAGISGILQGMEAELYEPYFLNRDTALRHKLYIFRKETINSDPTGVIDSIVDVVDPLPGYDLRTSGGESRIEHYFSKRLEGTLGIELTKNNFYNIDPSLIVDLEAVEDNRLFVQLGEIQWSTRDDELDATRGVFLSGKIEHSNEALLSDVNFAKLTWEGRYFIPFFWRTVLATRLKLGGIEPYGETTDVPANKRFFAGGPGSIRGYLLNRVGPLDPNDNPLGGNSLLEGSVEVRFPITDNFSGVLFVDFGNVWSNSFTYRLGDLSYGVGPGIRYLTPVGPLRLDIGIPLNRRESDDRAYRVEFSIGQAF